MNKNLFALVLILALCSASAHAQIEKVFVELYYVSDTVDATDTTGGILPAGSKTYRIYIDLLPGTKLRKVYGDANHALKIHSTDYFFNNAIDGQSFANAISKSRYGENTVALDSWLTLGQTTRTSTKTYFGIPKAQDRDGSFVGGVHNDGGSASISYGLLTNQDPQAGIPLTTSDGMDTMTVLPGAWGNYGFTDLVSGVDSTIFGSARPDSQFVSNNAGLQNSGIQGVIADSNQVLVAQLTTLGELSFELNVEVEETDGVNTRIVKYVANDDILLADERVSAHLKYPPVCGCTDPDYLEYLPTYSCGEPSACRTLIVFGCMDTNACNYDPAANYHIQSLCCYPGSCNDRDISIVCPQLSSGRYGISGFALYPNPSSGRITCQASVGDNRGIKYAVYDAFGRKMLEQEMGSVSGLLLQNIDISFLADGVYVFRLFDGEESQSKSFLKN